MKPTTLNTIEIASICDNKCAYCPAPTQGVLREVGLMSMPIFEASLVWLEHFVDQGTQRELNLHGIGEPTLNPNLVEMIRLAREITPGQISFQTNGNRMTEELARQCKEAGITSIGVTGHDAKITMEAIKCVQAAGVPVSTNQDFATTPNNWAGQVAWTESVDYMLECHWLNKGWVVVTWDGKVKRCCLDAGDFGVFGDVFKDFTDTELEPFKLCETCHHVRENGQN